MVESVAVPPPTLTSPWEAVYKFRRRLRDGWGDGFKGMVVFGSLARGDWGPDSDIDIMVLLDDSLDRDAESRRIWAIAFEMYELYEADVQPIVVSESRYRTGSAPLYFNIRREGWFVTADDQPEVVEKLLEQASNTLKEAELLLENEHYDGATSRGCYAMFNAAQAALASLGIYRSRHSGVIAAFGYQFVHLGDFPPDLHALLANAFEPRTAADYGKDSVEPTVAHEMISNARRFHEAVRKLLQGQAEQP